MKGQGEIQRRKNRPLDAVWGHSGLPKRLQLPPVRSMSTRETREVNDRSSVLESLADAVRGTGAASEGDEEVGGTDEQGTHALPFHQHLVTNNMYLIHPQHPSLQLAQVFANSGYWIWAEGGSLSERWVGQFSSGASRRQRSERWRRSSKRRSRRRGHDAAGVRGSAGPRDRIRPPAAHTGLEPGASGEGSGDHE